MSSNRLIPGLVEERNPAPPDVQVQLGARPSWLDDYLQTSDRDLQHVSSHKDATGRPIVQLWRIAGGSYLHLRYADETEFVVDRQGTHIWATWPASLSLEDTAVYLVGPVLGFVLGLRGVCCLHASVVILEGQAVALLGSAGAGKSTTAAAFARQGYPVLSDDVAALLDRHDHFLVQPAYPHLRLWPCSVAVLYGSPDALPTLTPTWDKRHLNLAVAGYPFQEKPAPLSAIYVLGGRRDEPAAPWVEALTGLTALRHLLGNTYASRFLLPSARAREFEVLGRLAQSVPVRRVVPHADPRRLDQLCDTIREDFRALVPRQQLTTGRAHTLCTASPPMSA